MTTQELAKLSAEIENDLRTEVRCYRVRFCRWGMKIEKRDGVVVAVALYDTRKLKNTP